MKKSFVKGINVCNPVDVEKDYLLYTVEYAHKKGFNHIQINGPIHDGVKGNIDGMTPNRKYKHFNNEKNMEYVEKCLDAVNAACEKTSLYGIKIYMWHHELELPAEFKDAFPEILNSYGDIEVTHPLVKDYLENKIEDFFFYYPKMDGIVLTLHETKIPLLKLKDQKLSEIDRVKYVTQILFDSCKKLGKELIVRPFASIEKDYEMMTKAYEEISPELPVMDKWTQFDWSLTAPSNRFFSKIKNNPLMVETDIYGEFFGRGFFPLMLKEHLKEKFAYCEKFSPLGYVNRIDREGGHPFGDINEVNIAITAAYLNGEDPEKAIDTFFESRYPQAANELKELMEKTEEVLKKTIYLNGYYFNSQSFFPALNHSKNHYYFEIMRKNCDMDSNEWFVPKDYVRGPVETLLEEKQSARNCAADLLQKFEQLRGKLNSDDYEKIYCKFVNLKAATDIWTILTSVIFSYVSYFDTRDIKYIESFEREIELLLEKKDEAIKTIGDDFFGLKNADLKNAKRRYDYIGEFAEEVKASFYSEKEALERMEKESLLDYVVCGGAVEGHRLQKEVNFSDTIIKENGLCRLAGSSRGTEWCSVNAHGWFSYLVKVKPNAKNTLVITAGGTGEDISIDVTVENEKFTLYSEENSMREFILEYEEKEGKDAVRIRFDKISASTPYVHTVKVLK